jgi:hypothetical protein
MADAPGGAAGAAPRPAAASYAKGTYWDGRYAERETSFDWFFTYDALRELICGSLAHTRARPCLHVGCGNSTLQLGMVNDGFDSVVNVSTPSGTRLPRPARCVSVRSQTPSQPAVPCRWTSQRW